MQREVDGQKQQLSSDQVALYRYRATQIRRTSDALRQGRVVLRQGRWHANQTVTTCEGQTVKPDLDARALAHIERRQNHSSVEVSVAWLEASDGAQLLLVANEDFCTCSRRKKPSDLLSETLCAIGAVTIPSVLLHHTASLRRVAAHPP